tara:strand:+ start:208 stop:345 length:138 start_codon:yes stop_codon:yes gene_type:complete
MEHSPQAKNTKQNSALDQKSEYQLTSHTKQFAHHEASITQKSPQP